MRFVNRHDELIRLNSLSKSSEGGLVVVYGRRRIGKTHLLLKWLKSGSGAYLVADHSAGEVQRRYFSRALAKTLPGFDQVEYPDWNTFFFRLAKEARQISWRGPLVIDELPYLVTASPELPSILQRWVDHEARAAKLVVALAGSSQRMMQGLALSADAPLYGRAQEILRLGALGPEYVGQALGIKELPEQIEFYAAFGGVPHYWELAARINGSVRERFHRLVLDPLGPLHLEPDRLLIEETPTAVEVRPVLDAIGMGANRVSEIAGKIGFKATSLSRPLGRIAEMGIVRREIPFGESEKKSRRSLYKIVDPFFRLWFKAVAPNRAFLTVAPPKSRQKLLDKYFDEQVGFVWEDICRSQVSKAKAGCQLFELAEWLPAGRWWHGQAPEWDMVATDSDGKYLLLGEVKWSKKPFSKKSLESAAQKLRSKPAPGLGKTYSSLLEQRALFVPSTTMKIEQIENIHIVTCEQLFSGLK